jgi:hypothetical protein
MALVFEELIRRFAESSNDTASVDGHMSQLSGISVISQD